MNERNKEKAKELLDLYQDVCASDEVDAFVSVLTAVTCAISLIMYPLVLCLALPLCGLMGLGCWKIKLDQKKALKKLGLTSKELTKLCRSGDMDKIYNYINSKQLGQNQDTNNIAESDKVESFDYLPGSDKSISRTSIYLSKPKKNQENDKSNEI